MTGGRSASRIFAVESQTFVLHCTAVYSSKAVKLFGTEQTLDFNRAGGGSSAIFAPDGRQISEDMSETEEGIIYADLEMDSILQCRSILDCAGHYSRPDLLWLGVDKREKKHIVVQSDD